ncbi:MAG TPA: undecaprenyldiphospho-muramoylpentapeptide beta-N-acetylglucosaminyltransferase [Kofleriaceae bacterium]|nr:undecaprenyldiphospho-muramoylpentapeptide beta-N-acetylglucosaminyltransferase [Kofleriaceae bacterium]
MRLMIAGGGTGGHLFPGVALADEAMRRDPASEVMFVGTERGIEARVLPELGWNLALIRVSGLKTVGALGTVRGLVRIPGALWQSRKVIKKFDPDVVVGVGGYASGPVVLMARLMGVPTAILEQNSIPGLANKILGKVVRAVFLAFEHTRGYFKARKIHMSGNPIRAEIALALEQPAERAAGAPPRLFVFGGSQGAMAVNELVVGAATLLAERGVALDILHQTGERDLARTEQAYAAAGITADCRAFIKHMAEEYRAADLVISRSGATTVAELTVVGRPAVLIPYPFAADNHQEINARELAEAGAALVFRQDELTAEALADAISTTLRDPETLERMGSAMKALGRPQAASAIVDWCQEQAR